MADKKKKGLKVFAFCVCMALIAACVALGLVIAKYRGISDDRIPGSMTYDTGEQSGTETIEGKDRDKGTAIFARVAETELCTKWRAVKLAVVAAGQPVDWIDERR